MLNFRLLHPSATADSNIPCSPYEDAILLDVSTSNCFNVLLMLCGSGITDLLWCAYFSGQQGST